MDDTGGTENRRRLAVQEKQGGAVVNRAHQAEEKKRLAYFLPSVMLFFICFMHAIHLANTGQTRAAVEAAEEVRCGWEGNLGESRRA